MWPRQGKRSRGCAVCPVTVVRVNKWKITQTPSEGQRLLFMADTCGLICHSTFLEPRRETNIAPKSKLLGPYY